MRTSIEKHRLWIFFVLAFAIAWGVWIPLVIGERELSLRNVVVFIGQSIGAYAPLFAVLITGALTPSDDDGEAILEKIRLHNLSWKLVLIAVALPPTIVLIANLINSLAGRAGFAILSEGVNQTLGWRALFFLPIQFVTAIFASPLGEEPGWRGFALPELQVKFGPLLGSGLLGLLWGVWHFPLLYVLGMAPNLNFLLAIMGHSLIIDAVYLKSDNLLIAILYHQAINTSITFLAGGINTLPAIVLTWIVAAVVRSIWQESASQ